MPKRYPLDELMSELERLGHPGVVTGYEEQVRFTFADDAGLLRFLRAVDPEWCWPQPRSGRFEFAEFPSLSGAMPWGLFLGFQADPAAAYLPPADLALLLTRLRSATTTAAPRPRVRP